MNRYLLDAGPLAAYLLGRTAAVELISPWILRSEAATSILVYGEVVEYFKSLPEYGRRRTELLQLLNVVHLYFLSPKTMEHYADIRRAMRPPHGSGLIGDIDTLIASTAIEHDLTIVTTDGDFSRVPDLNALIIRLRS